MHQSSYGNICSQGYDLGTEVAEIFNFYLSKS